MMASISLLCLFFLQFCLSVSVASSTVICPVSSCSCLLSLHLPISPYCFGSPLFPLAIPWQSTSGLPFGFSTVLLGPILHSDVHLSVLVLHLGFLWTPGWYVHLFINSSSWISQSYLILKPFQSKPIFSPAQPSFPMASFPVSHFGQVFPVTKPPWCHIIEVDIFHSFICCWCSKKFILVHACFLVVHSSWIVTLQTATDFLELSI